MDPRVKKLAEVLIHYSLKLKKGQMLRITGEHVTMPLMRAVFEEALAAGANPFIRVRDPQTEEYLLKHANDAQLKYLNPIMNYELDKIDALVHIWGSENTRFLSGVDPKRQAMQMASMRPLREKMFKRIGDGSLIWVGTQYPTFADAQDADMSLADYENFVYRAGNLHKVDPVKHWKSVHKEQMRLVKILNKARELHVRSSHADLKLKVKGRKWISCAGTENFPDGEIFTSPIEDSVEGFVEFTYPAVYMGREVDNVRLEYKKGKIVNETAEKNQDYLSKMLDMDRGARFVGEFAIGTNYEIKRFSRNILFDEKIGGTCHLAAGASIVESGGKNKSSLHWDMVFDMKKGGEIKADGKVIYRNGKFTI